MNTYIFNGPKNSSENTAAIDMLDGRVAFVGDEIHLSDSEAAVLGETLKLSLAESGQKPPQKGFSSDILSKRPKNFSRLEGGEK